MTPEQQQNHPLHGVKLDNVLSALLKHYGWEILAEQININCFKSYPSFDSSLKFLHKTAWAREKLEAFYLYKFKQYPPADDQQFAMPPRDRLIDTEPLAEVPAVLELGDGEFFDTSSSGKVAGVQRAPRKRSGERGVKRKPSGAAKNGSSPSGDPWAKWRDKSPDS